MLWMAKRKQKNLYLMPEPSWLDLAKLTSDEEKSKMFRSFEYFVHYEIADKKTIASVRKWLDKESGFEKDVLAKLKKVPDVWFGTFGKACFIWDKTGWMPEAHKIHLLNKIPPLVEKAEEIIEKQEEKKKEKPAISIQDRMKEQVLDLCGTWEGYLDMLLEGEFDLKKFDPYNEMRAYASGVIKPNHAKIIKDLYTGQHEEALEIVAWEDPDIKEGYSFMDAKLRKTHLEFFEKINSACDTMINTGKAQRKPRKPKAVSKEKLVAKLKYQLNDSVLGIASINPIEIIDATEVWVYNTKTRKLGVYKVGGLHPCVTVKGTTLQQFDEAKSVQKTLRKPAEQLKDFKGNAKTKYQKAFDEIKTTDTKMNGRFNDSTIILKVF